MDAVLVEELLDVLLGDVDELARGRDRDAARLLALEVDVRRPLVEPQPDHLELALEQLALAVRLAGGGVDDQQDEVAGARDADDLAAAAFALGGALDDPGQVEQLNPAVVVIYDPRNARQRGELIRRRLRFCGGEGVEDGRLADGREADERDARVALLLHVEALARPAARRLRVEQLRPILDELCAQRAQVAHRRLVDLREISFSMSWIFSTRVDMAAAKGRGTARVRRGRRRGRGGGEQGARRDRRDDELATGSVHRPPRSL